MRHSIARRGSKTISLCANLCVLTWTSHSAPNAARLLGGHPLSIARSQGSTGGTPPGRLKSARLRVTRVRPCASAVAAMEAVDGGQRSPDLVVEPAPALGNREIDRQQTWPQPGEQNPFEPLGKRSALGAGLQPFDAAAYLSDGEHAEMQAVVVCLLERSQHRGRRALASHALQVTRVEQEAATSHRSTSLVRDLSRVRFMSTSYQRGVADQVDEAWLGLDQLPIVFGGIRLPPRARRVG